MNGPNESGIEIVDGRPVTEERVGFQSEDLVACDGCGRSNAPTRAQCIYCGHALTAVANTVFKPARLEAWERGFNVVIVRDLTPSEVAVVLGMSDLDERAAAAVSRGVSGFPVGTFADENAANGFALCLSDSGIACRMVSDEEIDGVGEPIRIRGVIFCPKETLFIDFNTGERHAFANADVRLIVTGTIVESRNASSAVRTFLRTKSSEATTTTIDFPVVDVYAGPSVFRIGSSGFDFSCLGDYRAMTAAENLHTLFGRFRERFSGAAFDDSYRVKRPILDSVWPVSTTKDPGAPQHALFKSTITRIETVSNTGQFTKYSRLMRLLV